MATPDTHLAENLRRLRHAADLTQAGLAARAGVARATLANMEQPDANPGIQAVMTIAKALGVGVDELCSPPPDQRYYKVTPKDYREYRDPGGRFVAQMVSPIASRGVQIQTVTMYPECVSPGRPHPVGAQEYYFAVDGTHLVVVDGDEVTVEPGCLIQFPGHLQHVYCNRSREETVHALSIVVLAL